METRWVCIYAYTYTHLSLNPDVDTHPNTPIIPPPFPHTRTAVALRFLDPREWAPGTLTKADFKRREAELPTEGGLCFVGLVSLVDPPKPRVAEAVQQCKVAGVRWAIDAYMWVWVVVMVVVEWN